MCPPQDTRRDVDVKTVVWYWTAVPVGRSGTGLAHVGPEKVRYSTDVVLPELVDPPRTRRCSGKREQ